MLNERNKGVILSYIQVLLIVIVNLIYVPVLLHFLGKSEYGLYQITGSFFAYVTVFESSISSGVLRSYCKALHLHDSNMENETLSAARKIYRILSLFIAIVGAILCFAFYLFYKSSFSGGELKEGTIILAALFVNFIIIILGSVYLTIITGNEKFIFLKTLNIIVQILQPFLVILLVIKFPYALVITLVMTSLNFVSVISRWWYSKHKLNITIVAKNENRAIMREIIGLASTILLASIADQIFWKADQLILGKIYGTAIVAIYSVGAQIYNIYMSFGTQISSVYYPRMSELYHQDDGLKKVSDLFIEIGRVVFLVLLLILSGFIVFGEDFISLWVGPDYHQAYYVAILVMIPFSIDLAQNIGLSILQITGQYGFRAKMYFWAAIINIFSTIFLSIVMGIVGAALSTGLTMLVTSGITMNWYFDRRVGLDIKKYWKKCLPIILVAFLLTLAGIIVKKLLVTPANSFIMLTFEIIIYLIIYCCIMYAFIMNKYEKSLVKNVLRKKHL